MKTTRRKFMFTTATASLRRTHRDAGGEWRSGGTERQGGPGCRRPRAEGSGACRGRHSGRGRRDRRRCCHSAARAGATTVLVEMGGQLGGTTTTGGVSYPGLFHAWGRQVIAGIGWELVFKSVQLDTGILPDFSKPPQRHPEHQVRVNGPLYAAILEEAFLEAGGRLCYYELTPPVRATDGGYELELVGKESERRVVCRQLIDCTGDANVIGKLGLPRLRDKTIQPATMMFELGNYETAQLDADLIEQRYREALRDKRLRPGDVANPASRFINFLRSRGSNAQHVLSVDGSTSAGKTQANIAGRQSVLRILRFVRSLPGCEQARLVRMQTETGIRETYRIVGETTITEADYVGGRVFDDAVCHAFYPIDIHDEHGVKPVSLRRHRADRAARRLDPQGQSEPAGRRPLGGQRSASQFGPAQSKPPVWRWARPPAPPPRSPRTRGLRHPKCRSINCARC